MKILIVGCGRTGSRLASRLAKGGHDVTVIDEKREAFERLGPDFPGVTLQGSGLEIEMLRRASVDSFDFVLAVTGGDNRNLMVAQMAQKQFKVEKVLARLHDPVRAAKYRELGVETLCTTTVIEGLLELYVREGAFPTLPGEMSPTGDASCLCDDVPAATTH
jgi:trk system potassium uptake protein TrkA